MRIREGRVQVRMCVCYWGDENKARMRWFLAFNQEN